MSTLHQQQFLQAIVGHWESLLRDLAKQPLAIDPFLRRAKIRRISYGHYESMTTQQVLTLMKLSMEQLNIDGIGLRIANRLTIEDTGALGFAMLGCKTLKQLLETIIHIPWMTSDYVDIRIAYDREYAYITAEDRSAFWTPQPYTIEDSIGHYYLGIKKLLGEQFDKDKVSISLSYAAPSYKHLYHQYLGIMPTFNAASNQIRLPIEWIDMPISANESLVANIAAKHSAEMNQQSRASTSCDQIRMRLYALLSSGVPTMEQMAEDLGFTARTLRRRLHDEGKTYKQLVLDVRMQMANEYLLKTSLSLSDIANLLDYHSAPPFIRAFKAYHQVSPSQFKLETKKAQSEGDWA
ncbi:AraC family transcriptional regulator [Vibrio mediterranei]|uniref:AraC family transcriptional regulator n=1 Tax=Vibrio mediterranei TaxID=689 RepID=UPI00148D12E3|nr:AraC family transcriptional regulator [Vibrio mediterranei]